MIHDDQFNDPFGRSLPDIQPAASTERGDDPAAVWRARRELIANAVQPTIETTDYEEACADAIDWILPDLTLIGRDAAAELEAHYRLEL